MALCTAPRTAIAEAVAGVSSSDDGVDPAEEVYPVVITPTRLRQPLADVPASVTVISAETIHRYGITSIAQALRLVPGMHVTQVGSADYRINYHGTNVTTARRINVMVDGYSVYQPAISQVEWGLLPVAIEDVDRIEVIRGTDSSSYGPDSMMGIVNILTKHPQDVPRALLSQSGGPRGDADTTLRLATAVGSTSVRLTAQTEHDSGYDIQHYDGRPVVARNIDGDHDSSRVKRLNLRAQQRLADGSTLDFQASHARGDMQVLFGDYLQAADESGYPDRKLTESMGSLRWRKSLSADHEVQVELFHSDESQVQRYRTCYYDPLFWPEVGQLYRQNPVYLKQLLQVITGQSEQLPSGGTAADDAILQQLLTKVTQTYPLGIVQASQPNCGRINSDATESRTHIEVQDTLVLSPALRLVGGMGLRYQNATSDSYFAGTVSNTVKWAFGHAEWRITDALMANVGGYGERNSLSGGIFSPRVALNAKLSDEQAVRAVWSRGTRTPDLYERRAHLSFEFVDLDRPIDGSNSARESVYGYGNPYVRSERVRSTELGYLLTLRRIGLTMDARLFDEHLSDLISDHLAVFDFTAENSASVRLTGGEMQADWEWSPRWSARMSYAYLLNRQATKPVEVSQYWRHSGSVGVSYALTDAWRASLGWQGATGDGISESGYGRTDLTLLHGFLLGVLKGEFAMQASYLQQLTTTTYQDARDYTSAYDRHIGLYGRMSVAF